MIVQQYQAKSIQDFQVIIPIELMKARAGAREIVNKSIIHPDTIDVLHLLTLDFQITTYGTDKNDLLIFLEDDDSLINNQPFLFVFGMEFNQSIVNISEPQRPIIRNLGDINASVGEKFTKKVLVLDPNGDEVFFSSLCDLFEIDNKTGVIEFTAEDRDLGEHVAVVKAIDETGLETVKFIVINISTPNQRPRIESIENQVAYVNTTFYLEVKAHDPENDNIFFLDNTSWFEINPTTGIINFTPSTNFTDDIEIVAVDIRGGLSNTSFTLEVKNE
jgi:hypothetical protein